MRTDDELFEMMEKYAKDSLNRLWDELTPEERRRVFPGLLNEWVEVTF